MVFRTESLSIDHRVPLKTDFGERIPHANVVFHDGSDPMRIHNLYSVVYNELVFNLLKERFGEGEAVVFARSSTVGGQRFPVVRICEGDP
jgi:alpha-glucosidase (family GH31 glycosyl hydrolase)